MDTAYGGRVIRRIGNWSNAFSCEVEALIRRIPFAGYGVCIVEFDENPDNKFIFGEFDLKSPNSEESNSEVKPVIIMAQPQRPADVHQDELCPPNKIYSLMDANKKVDLENPLCLDESRILENILQNYLLRFSIAASSSVPLIYLGQFWHTLQEDRSKNKLKFMLDIKDLTLTLDDFRTIFHLPQATDNNHDHFVPAPKFSEMVPFYVNNLGCTLELRSTSNFKTIGLLQPWQTLCKMFSRCLTIRVTGYDQPSLQIMQMLFTKLIVSHYMTTFPEISRRTRDRYHNLADDVMIKSILIQGRGTHRTTSALRTPNPEIAKGESSASRKYTIIRLRIPPTPIPITDEADDLVLQDILQVSLAEQKSHEELKAKQNVEKVKEHLMAEEIKKLELTKTVTIPSSSTPSSSSSKVFATNRLLSLLKPKPRCFKRYKNFFDELQGKYGYLFGHLTTRFMPKRKINELARHLQDIMMESLPKMVDERIKKILQTQVPLHVIQGIILEREKSQAEVDNMIDDAIQQERENFLSEISSQVNDAIINHIPSAKRQKTSEHGMFICRELLSGQDYESELGPSTSGNQEQPNEFDFWTNSYAIDDDVLPNEKVSQELVDEISQTVDEAKLRKVVDEMLRQQFVQSCQRDPKAPAPPLVNQDLLYLKKGNSRPEKIVLSLHKFPIVIFPDDDIEERTSRWNPHAEIFYIKKQQESRKPKEEIYSNSKIVQIIKTYWELGHEHKFITQIVAKRANGSIMSISEPDYKNLNKNDIEDIYMLIINHKVDDYAETGLCGKLSAISQSYYTTITFLGIENYEMFSIITDLVYGIIYKNSKKEKRVMRHQEIHKFCDATLKRVLEGLKSYNNNVKYGYVTSSLSKEDVEYLQLFDEEIEERLKRQDQMRRWEMYVNERPLGSRRERLE
ncbi:hypothetical protein Tco_0377036 [Tanacetum coccineum]